jgi:hypothetical protein
MMYLQIVYDRLVNRLQMGRRARAQAARRRRVRLALEELEDRTVPSGTGFTLGPLVQVSGPSPFAGCTDPGFGNGPTFADAEVEPTVAVDPTNPNHVVTAWTQDDTVGIVAGVSFDGGMSWGSVVIPGLTTCSGGTRLIAGDPWLSFAPNGDLYASAVTLDDPNVGGAGGIMVSKSTDGGLSWTGPIAISNNTNELATDDKASITADPTNANDAYIVWDRSSLPQGILHRSSQPLFGITGVEQPTLFSQTTDGGQTWSAPRVLYDPGANAGTIASRIIVEPDGTLVALTCEQDAFKNDAHGGQFQQYLVVLRSKDQGQSWQGGPIFAAQFQTIDPFDPETGVPIRTGSQNFSRTSNGGGVFFDAAVDRNNGNLYAVWEDARFSGGQYNSIVFSQSTDGGLTWSAPIKINQTPTNIPAGDQQAFTPSVAVSADGTVAVAYYDFRNNTPAPGLLTDRWMVFGQAGTDLSDPANWGNEQPLTNASFDIETAPFLGSYFLGDYQALAAAGNAFDAVWSMPHTNPDGTIDHASIFFRDPPPAKAETTTAQIDSFGLLVSMLNAPLATEPAVLSAAVTASQSDAGNQALPLSLPSGPVSPGADQIPAASAAQAAPAASRNALDLVFSEEGDDNLSDGLGLVVTGV